MGSLGWRTNKRTELLILPVGKENGVHSEVDGYYAYVCRMYYERHAGVYAEMRISTDLAKWCD